ncbi:hypothetical protein DERF_008511 [Dermatophagoides farinae]|uniref:Uncharacterized protein n=1 Tax=Dermatophagoides farinae TaxID=6954 RepID=A0A922I143_DERFA|nr:hypothetical protein DERF_008511 [Dermatophagoides farinae]
MDRQQQQQQQQQVMKNYPLFASDYKSSFNERKVLTK